MVLKKDIVIPAGTKFQRAPYKTKRHGNVHWDCVIGLSPNSSGDFCYCVEPDDEELKEWFEGDE